MQQLIYLSLNFNSFSGEIPPSIGNLSKLFWLDLTGNQLTGSIPVSSGTTPGLDMLVHAKHFHLGKNKLSGKIPPQLFSSDMTLIHVLLDNNKLTGNIPSTLGLLQTLEVVRLDRNQLTGSVPSNLNNLTSVSELSLSNARLTGPIPDLTGMYYLTFLDISNNSFDASDFPLWISTSLALTTLMMESTQIQGKVPTDLFNLPQLQTVVLRNNKLNDTLDIGTSYSDKLQLIDLQNNLISDYKQRLKNEVELILVGNPVCQKNGMKEHYCSIRQYAPPPNNCVLVACTNHQISSPNCQCSYPYTGLVVFRAPSFSNLGNTKDNVSLEKTMMDSLKSHKLPVDFISLSNPRKDAKYHDLVLDLMVFPSGGDRFNRTVISDIEILLRNDTCWPFYFFGDAYQYFSDIETKSHKSTSTTIIIGVAVGGCALLLLLLLVGIYTFRQKKRTKKATEQNNPFAHWDSSKSKVGVPQLQGTKFFSFEEIKKCTNNFSEANDIGSGGYGKVYRGSLPNGQLIAIKRAKQESMQGGLEFKNEIELLSRVHHKNLVSLLGFCFERGEQMLIYEFVPNGNLRDSLSGKSGIKLDWIRRLKICIGAARGLTYLHELANPPIIHRDIKSTNILLDERLNAKVGDFGLSKLISDSENSHVSTQVKGTLGYMDPEYFMTQQLTEKSDVYGFGVLMLELVTGKKPIERGKYIVRKVRMAIDKTKPLYNLQELVDTDIRLDTTLKGLDKFVDLAMKCVQELGADRPTMGEVVKEIENIMQLVGLNPSAESASTSVSHDDASKGNHPHSQEDFSYSGGYPASNTEPH